MSDDPPAAPESLLPYDAWTEAAMRQVMVRALAYVATHGLPGEHHFYVTFRTDHPGVVIPPRLRAQYPQEMTIVLQHQFWDLKVDQAADRLSVGLSFGGVPSTLVIPLAAVSAFADPLVRFGLRFTAEAPEPAPDVAPALPAPAAAPDPQTGAEPPTGAEPQTGADAPEPQVVSLDAFRRRTPPKA